MNTDRRKFLKTVAASTIAASQFLQPGDACGERPPYSADLEGRLRKLRAKTGLTIESIETFTQAPDLSIVRVRTNDGAEGYGQISWSDADISAQILHRKIARHALGADPADFDAISDRAIEANYKFPWSFVCRALAGVDTAIWDLLGKQAGKSVCVLLGGTPRALPVYGSSMSRTIQPAAEAERLARLRDAKGFTGFKIRLGKVCGHDEDQWPGRTEAIIPAVRKALGDKQRS